MGKTKGENTKKAAGNAKKAESAAKKQEAVDARVAAQEDAEWSKGSKSSAKKEDAAAKKAEAAQKKAERDALLAQEEASARSTPKTSKTATKKSAPAPSRGTLDLSQLDAPASSSQALNATGIDSALDLLSLTSSTAATDAGNIDRHPERRFKAAYKAFEERRLPEIEKESPGLRRNQRIEMCRKEFEKSPENPFNQVSGRFDSTREDLRGLAEGERKKKEAILGGER